MDINNLGDARKELGIRTQQQFDDLDALDGKKDGKISESIFNKAKEAIEEYGTPRKATNKRWTQIIDYIKRATANVPAQEAPREDFTEELQEGIVTERQGDECTETTMGANGKPVKIEHYAGAEDDFAGHEEIVYGSKDREYSRTHFDKDGEFAYKEVNAERDIETITRPDGATVTIERDVMGNTKKITKSIEIVDPNKGIDKKQFEIVYKDDGSKEIKLPGNVGMRASLMVIDKNGNAAITIGDTTYNVTEYNIDDNGNLLSFSYPFKDGTWKYTFDESGKLKQYEYLDSKGSRVSNRKITYNDRNQVKTDLFEYSEGKTRTTYTYDEHNNLKEKEWKSTTVDKDNSKHTITGRTTYEYDNNNKLQKTIEKMLDNNTLYHSTDTTLYNKKGEKIKLTGRYYNPVYSEWHNNNSSFEYVYHKNGKVSAEIEYQYIDGDYSNTVINEYDENGEHIKSTHLNSK